MINMVYRTDPFSAYAANNPPCICANVRLRTLAVSGALALPRRTRSPRRLRKLYLFVYIVNLHGSIASHAREERKEPRAVEVSLRRRWTAINTRGCTRDPAG